jgi:2-polyprenyl-3-methyl-5-hydroxy-6-metoxy-1,4-benzoquinol methylase
VKCRYCSSELSLRLIDLGTAPPSNAYLTASQLNMPERWYPLRVFVCTTCWLAQTEDFTQFDELFACDYAYFSSYSASWLDHAEKYVIEMIEQFNLHADSFVVEVACNDGYLLQKIKSRGIPCLGIEPTQSTALVAQAKGINVKQEFFGAALAERLLLEGKRADLMVANNVLAHVPNIGDFVRGFAVLLAAKGVATFEFPHLLSLIDACQFDTIYHEHFSYLSFTAVAEIFKSNGLKVFRVEQLSTHGGSLRVFAERSDSAVREEDSSVVEMLNLECNSGIKSIGFYSKLQQRADDIKDKLLQFLIGAKAAGHTVVGYGAAAKGNTLLNYAGVKADLLRAVVDRSPAKQGKFLPGSRIPIFDEDYLANARPRYVFILPWNLRTELTNQLSYIRSWGGQFVSVIPELSII